MRQGMQEDVPGLATWIRGKFRVCHNRVATTAAGSATSMLPVPITLMAFRFFEPKTPPNPPVLALMPLP